MVLLWEFRSHLTYFLFSDDLCPKYLDTSTLLLVEHNLLIIIVWVEFLWHEIIADKWVYPSNILYNH